MNDIDKLIARLGFQLVQYELALVEAQKQIAELQEQVARALKPEPSEPSQGIAFPQS